MHRTRCGALSLTLAVLASPAAWAAESLAVGAQYDTTHVYVQPGKMDDFVNSLLHTFGGKATKRITADVTPTPSETLSQLVLTPVGSFSVFDFKTPAPYPFGDERNGFLVRDMDAAVAQAKAAGADVLVEPFPDPIGRDAVVQWPGGVNMQLYWHTTAPDYAPLSSVPENRVYLSRYRVEDFIRSYQQFSQGKVDRDQQVSAAVIGGTRGTVREVDLSSTFGKVKIFVTDGHLLYPFGRERTGYGVTDLQQTLDKALASHAKLLWRAPENSDPSAMVEFPGGYIAEIHQVKG